MPRNKFKPFALLAAVMLALTSFGPASHTQAQGNSRTFPETGKSVSGRFLEYWNTHGGLAQQGFPISEPRPEISDTDGKTYVVQYFERAVFELHTEFAPPNDILLSLLGVFLYNRKYPAGAPGQTPNAEAGSHLFAETGKHVGGLFLKYWTEHGGLAQQGYPISEEFNEKSDLNGQTYKVQYFQRAVFEFHPEQAPPYNVLLSQLGTTWMAIKNAPATATPAPVLPTATPAQPINTPAPPATNTPQPGADCSGIPQSVNQTVTPNCGPRGTRFTFDGFGFTPGELVGIYATEPDQSVFGAPFQATADAEGRVSGISLTSDFTFALGIWANSMEGTSSHVKSIGYFKIVEQGGGGGGGSRDCSGIPDSVNMIVSPNCAPAGGRFAVTGLNFQPGESVGRYYTSPTGRVIAGSSQSTAESDGRVTGITFSTATSSEQGIWVATFEGVSSHRRGLGYFKVTAP